ncbi:elongation factor P maturation arginine rhamnosyltransferase EarP, partial [Pseudomonas lactis]
VKYKGVQKYFFFPGFRPGTGGLLREAGLLERRQAFQQDDLAQQQFLQSLGVAPTAGARLMSLFAYENDGLAGWLDVLAADRRGTHLLVPEGRILGDVQRWLGVNSLSAGDIQVRGALTVQVIAFVRQEQYDRLLWCCEFNAVRGEDSFVRAQWAGRPLLWHIYRQDEDIHLDKLDAFLELYTAALSPTAKAAVVTLWQAWNADGDMAQSWKMLLEHWPEVSQHAQNWCLEQGLQADLATALVQFYESWI